MVTAISPLPGLDFDRRRSPINARAATPVRMMAAPRNVGLGIIEVVYGANAIDMALAGLTVGEICLALRDVLNVDFRVEAYADGRQVPFSYELGEGERLVFMKTLGDKAGDPKRKKHIGKPDDLLPPHTPEERAALKASLQCDGLRRPVIIAGEDDYIMDGRLLVELCNELGIPWHKDIDIRFGLSNMEKQALRIQFNIARRHTAPTQAQRRNYVEIMLLTRAEENSDDMIGQIVGVSQSTVTRRKNRLIRDGKLVLPEERLGRDGKKRRTGRRRDQRVSARSKRDYEKTIDAAKQVKGHFPDRITPSKLQNLAKRERRQAEAKRTRGELPPEMTLRCCDFRDLDLEPETVDLLLTDVMWTPECFEDWKDLGKLASRWLKPKGLFITLFGKRFLPRLIQAIEESLQWQWLSEVPFEHTFREKANKIVTRSRLFVFFSRDEHHNFDGVHDWFDPAPFEKDFDPLQMSLTPTREILERLTKPGDLVVDPCTCTGTVGVACVTAKGGPRRFIGCDIEKEKVAIARGRILQAIRAMEDAAPREVELKDGAEETGGEDGAGNDGPDMPPLQILCPSNGEKATTNDGPPHLTYTHKQGKGDNGRTLDCIACFGIPPKATCPAASELCSGSCFALFGLQNLHSERWQANFAASELANFPLLMVDRLKGSQIEVFRPNAWGDLYNEDYARKWLRIVSECPDITFYMQTRTWVRDEMVPVLIELARQPNMHLWLSLDRTMPGPCDFARDLVPGARTAWLAATDTDAPEDKADVVFRMIPPHHKFPNHDELRFIGDSPVCLHEVHRDPKDQHLNKTCWQCRRCFEPPKKDRDQS